MSLLMLMSSPIDSGGGPPSSGEVRITAAGDVRITASGDRRVVPIVAMTFFGRIKRLIKEKIRRK